MQTELLRADTAALRKAAALLAEGQLVAFPTETVYGLGANALDEEAVRSIFAAKGRPADNPLIVHIWNRDQLRDICEVTPEAEKLMDAYWPGPLTITLPKKSSIPDVVTAGMSTVAVRMPSHPLAAALLKACDLPIAAPSANRSGKPSPTTAQHVFQDMDGRIPLILDGGDCDVGVESTVVGWQDGKLCIYRPGGITEDMLRGVVGEVTLAGSILRPLEAGEKVLSPGMKYRHYAPEGQVSLVEGSELQVLTAMRLLVRHAEADGKRACVMCFDYHADALQDCHPHTIGKDAAGAAHALFDTLRRLDDEHMDMIFSEVLPPVGVGLAVMNRLGRAAAFHKIDAVEVIRELCPWKAVLFDLDGTLTNTLDDIANAMNRALRLHHLPEWPVEAYKYLVGNGARKLAERAVRDRQDLQASVLAEYQAYYETHTNVVTRPYEGIPELLYALQELGLQLCVFSNKPDADTKHVVAYYFPEITFAAVQGQLPDVPVKPDPAGAKAIAARMQLPPEAFLYLGDTSVDMTCAVAAGMHPVGVLWGFREEKELRESGAKVLLEKPMDLLSVIG